MTESVLIAGCGYVGSALARRLLEDGHTVWALRRSVEGLPGGVRAIPADLTSADTMRGLPDDVDYVFFTAAAKSHHDRDYLDVYVRGLRNLLDALQDAGARPRRFFFTSSTSVYGHEAGEWVDESSPTNPAGFAGERMLEAERLVLGGPFPSTVVRLGGIYGPGRTRLLDDVRSGEAFCVQGPPRYTNRIHRDDAAGVLRHLMGVPQADALYLAVDDDPAERCAVLRWLAERVGATPPSHAPAAPTEIERRRSSKRCTNWKLRQSGYRFRYPSFREGYSMILRGDA